MHVEPIRVLVRVRPTNRREMQSGGGAALDVDGNTVCVTARNHKVTCSYDRVLGSQTTQAEVFSELRTCVEGVLRGINCTIFAYGQTGTGKTHTMLGARMEQEMAKQAASARVSPSWGVIPRALAHLFR